MPNVQVGSEVKGGETLYVLDLRPYEGEVEKAPGDLAQTEANLDFGKRQVALIQAEGCRSQKLWPSRSGNLVTFGNVPS